MTTKTAAIILLIAAIIAFGGILVYALYLRYIDLPRRVRRVKQLADEAQRVAENNE